MPLLRRLLVLLFTLVLAGAMRAHDARESTLELRVSAEGLEISALLSNASAAGLLTPPDAGPITKATFSDQHAGLLAAASRVCTLTDSTGKTLPPARTHVSLSPNGELRCFFQYPASLRTATLRVDLLSTLAPGYFVEVTDRTVKPVRRVVLVRGHATYAFVVPGASP